MENLSKIYRLHAILSDARHPVPMRRLCEALACSERHTKRIIHSMQDRFNAPIEYSRQRNGWHYREGAGFTLPGFWLNEQELYALLTIQQLLGNLDPVFLQDGLQPFKQRIQDILEKTTGLKSDKPLGEFIRLLPYNRRDQQYARFQTIASACLQRQQLRVTYHNRSHDQRETRILSPQLLIYYRDNWYLGAYCHNKGELHPFSLDRIQEAETLPEPCHLIPNEALEEVFFSTFGIFSGVVQAVAVLQFTPEAARWVDGVTWHKDQHASWQEDGTYVLKVPYSLPTELIGEILRFGEGVTVLEPPELRSAVCEKLEKMVANYKKCQE